MPLITLTTDFGLASHYPAQMKGVILSLCPEAQIVDITHGIRPQRVRAGAVVLADVTPQFPPGTLHVAVVDPGVGTARQLVYAEIGAQRYLAPDNGLLTAVASQAIVKRAFYVQDSRFWRANVSHTFHGRDILAPVAAHLANGLPPEQFGPACQEIIRLNWPQVSVGSDHVLGEVLLVDSFGNLLTNITAADLQSLGPHDDLSIRCGGIEVAGIQATYGLASPGETVAVFDSQGRLELAVVNGSAAELWGVDEEAAVEVRKTLAAI